ncbi:MAG: hypothetical protein IJP11_02610 [Oscillospiraceae bacterium]|nr:hypothetical protein [Oscillospiraceae bacterium]
MEGLEGTIQQILGDPESMAQILSLAKSFGLPTPQSEAGAASPQEDLSPMIELLKQTAAQPRETRLLEALMPYFSAERQQRLERAVRVARVAQMAGAALKNMAGKEQAHV